MLHKSFKPAKCKTSLRLATSRIKLMRNKKGVQINQLKRDLARLLESGQDRAARIRVEHVIREEKMVGAYDLIEIYCELIVARLPIIESQKTCPVDLKEAITSVIFAAPRCSDVTELQDIRKHFTAKYGKVFVSAALELRPDCGVSRMLVEKLSAVAPNVQTKVKVLSAVANEFGVKWDPASFEEKESKPSADLLNGPASFENTTVDPQNIQASKSHDEKQHPPVDFSQHNRRYTLDTQHTTSIDNGRHNWTTEFKDAESAAHAAAESAQRASMAARAAVRLSNQGKGSPESNVKETPQVSAEHRLTDSYESSFNGRRPKIPSQKVDRSEPDTSRKAGERGRSSGPVSWKPRNGSRKDDKSANGFHESSPSSPKTCTKKDFKEPDKESFGLGHEDLNRFAEDVFVSSRSTIGGERGGRKFSEKTTVGDPFANRSRETATTSADDDDGPRFDMGFEYDEGEAKSFFPSPGKESPGKTHLSIPGKNGIDTVGQVSSRFPVRFDRSGGPDSDGKTELAESRKDPEPAHVESSRKVRIELNDLVETEPPFYTHSDDEERPQFSPRHERRNDSRDARPYDDFVNQRSDLDTGKEFGSGTMTGGLQTKGGRRYPPYAAESAAVAVGALPFCERLTEESRVASDQTSRRSSFNSRTSRAELEEPNVSVPDSDSDGFGDGFSSRSSRKASKNANTRSQFSPPVSSFDETGTDSEAEAPEQVSAGRVRSGPGPSRRTKGSSSAEGETVISGSNDERKPGRRSYAGRFKKDDHELATDSTVSKRGESLNSRAAEPPSRKTSETNRTEPQRQPRERFHRVEAPTMPEPRNSPRKTVEPVKTESGTTSAKKPSHVHPKLPDYDSLAALIQSLRTNQP